MPHNATNQKSYDIVSNHDFASHHINQPITHLRQTLADSIACSANVAALCVLILEDNRYAQNLNSTFNKHLKVATGTALTQFVNTMLTY